jgi:hypothetical protein
MSATNMKRFNISKQREGQVIPFYNNKFIMGNDELIVYLHNMTYSVIFSTTSCYFETRFKDVVEFLGTEEEKGAYSNLEFHSFVLEDQ